MAYSPKGVMDIYEILSRWHAGCMISGIAEALGAGRKTMRRYVRAVEEGGLLREEPLPERGIAKIRMLAERIAPEYASLVVFAGNLVNSPINQRRSPACGLYKRVVCHGHDVGSRLDSSSSNCLRHARSLRLARRIINDMSGAISAENPDGRPRLRRVMRVDDSLMVSHV